MLSNTTFFLSKTFLLSQFSPPLQPMLSMIHVTRGHLRSYLTSFYQNFAPPSAAHAFNYIPFIKNIPFITIFPPSAAHAFNDTRYQGSFPTLPDFLLSKFSPPSAADAFNYIPFIKHIPFIQIFPLPLQPMHSTTFLLWKTFLLSKFPHPLCSPCFQLHSFYQKHSFYQNFPPLCSPCFQWFRLPGVICDPTWLPFIQIFLPSAAHAFNYKIPFIKNIPFITIFPPSAAHAFNYIPFIKNIPFIKIFPPSAAHAFNDSGYQGSSATLPDFLLSKCFPPSAAHAFNYNIPFIKNILFIAIFPPSAAHAFNDTRCQGSSATLPDFLLSQFPPPLQPMLSTTTFLLSKTFLL